MPAPIPAMRSVIHHKLETDDTMTNSVNPDTITTDQPDPLTWAMPDDDYIRLDHACAELRMIADLLRNPRELDLGQKATFGLWRSLDSIAERIELVMGSVVSATRLGTKATDS